ncbi:MAG: amino acid permease [Acidobacteriota bacterium]|jgi:amino acid transporter/nucleotide-binding universal stress UspA family protein
MPTEQRTELSRDLGLFTITMVGVGAMIGAGIFVLTGIAAGTAGPALILAFAANGVVTFLTALAYAELGSAIPEAGGGYLWVKQGLPGPNAFLAGWMSWFAHAVAGSLYALGFGSYLGLVLEELGWLPASLSADQLEKPLAVAVAVLFVAINFKGVSETGLAGNVVTMAKVAIIGVFVVTGLWAMFSGSGGSGTAGGWNNFTPFAPEGLTGVLTAMGLTYIAFEGYEIIVQAGEEVKDPKRNIPRAVFWSLAIVIPIYILVAIAAVGAVDTGDGTPTWQWLGAHQELGLAEAARQFMPLGTTLLLVGGLLSTMSALNATTFSSTRVSFAMGRDRNLPDAFARVHDRTRTPYLALAASGALIIFMAVTLPIEDVAAAADVMFLLLFLQVNVAIITIRRKYGDMLDYGFLIPFFPVLPVVAIVLMLGIAAFMFHFSPVAWYFVVGWIGIGFLLYYTYARRREHEKRATPVVLREELSREEGYRILLPIAEPDRARSLIRLAALMARSHGGEITLLHVIPVPGQTPLRVGREWIREARDEVLDRAEELLGAEEVPFDVVIRVAHKPADAILDELTEEDVDMIVMGWRGHSRHPRTAIGSNIDHVLRHADCHVLVFKGRDLEGIESILAPVSHPEQAHLIHEVAGVLAAERGARIRLYHAVDPAASAAAREREIEEIREALVERTEETEDAAGGEAGPDTGNDAPEIEIEETRNVTLGIVRRSDEYDLTLIGASREGWWRKLVAGTIPERVMRRARGRLLLVKHRRSVIRSRVLDVIDFFRD